MIPSRKFMPYSTQQIDRDDIDAVAKVLYSDWITQGPKIKEFEKKISSYCGAKYTVVASSGTAALHLACLAAGIKAGDEVITSPITFVASANCVLYCSGRPVFVDIQKDTANIDPNKIEEKITKNTTAIIPVHFAGHPCDLERISHIAKRHDLLVIEDACHALGAQYKGQKIGNCKYSDMTVFSFHPVKSITTGEGGAVLTNNKDYYEKLIMFRQHGVTKDDMKFKLNNEGNWYYEMHYLGYNYRLTDIQCALGLSQLYKLNKFIQKRREIARIYNHAFKNNNFFEFPMEKKGFKSSWHLYAIKLKDEYKAKKKLIFSKLRERGLWIQVHYIPVYWHPYYQKLGYNKEICTNAEDFYQREISIPLYQSMNERDVKYVIDSILNVFEKI